MSEDFGDVVGDTLAPGWLLPVREQELKAELVSMWVVRAALWGRHISLLGSSV